MKELLPRQILGSRYQIVSPLAEGGFGHTYIAEDMQRPGRPKCVVKRLQPASSDPKFLEDARRLFHSEAETLEKLGRHHTQIPLLLAYFEEDKEFYLVQDFIEGPTLTEELQLGERWPESHILQMLTDVLGILSFIHKQQVIHRDIKPDNLIRRRLDSKFVLVDFGAVKQIRTQLTILNQANFTISIGTPGYMSTEQGHGKPRFNSDIYALGIICIQAATGLHPSQLQEDPNTGEIIWRPWALISQGLADILTKMVRYHFKDRYKSAEAVLQAVDSLLHQGRTWDPNLQSGAYPSASTSADLSAQAPSTAPNPTLVSQAEPQPDAQGSLEPAPVFPNPTEVSSAPPQPPSGPAPQAPTPTFVSQAPPPNTQTASAPGPIPNLTEVSQAPSQPNLTEVSQAPSQPLNASIPAAAHSSVAPNPTLYSPAPPQSPNVQGPSEPTSASPNPTVISQGDSQQPYTQAAAATHTPISNPAGPQQTRRQTYTQVLAALRAFADLRALAELRALASKLPPTLTYLRSIPLKFLVGAGALFFLTSIAIVVSANKTKQAEILLSWRDLVQDLPCQDLSLPPLPNRSPDYSDDNGVRYYGDFSGGVFSGQGIMVFANGDRYDGAFRDGKRQGCGTLSLSDGARYTGEFQDDNFDGLGQWILKNGDRYIGEFKNNQCHGQGIFFLVDGRPHKSGLWREGKFVEEDTPFSCYR
ncbi:MAG: protein kinase [Leptolyngbyaceae cyanobacterium MO_188.B28]|nr:protein kinase [Leptolyngbyaceae cyanobacterium MO_188.B28]